MSRKIERNIPVEELRTAMDKINKNYSIKRQKGRYMVCFICGNYTNDNVVTLDNGREDDSGFYVQLCPFCIEKATKELNR